MASRQAAERAAGQSPGAGGVEVAGARLLVIDDEQRILDFVARGLRAEGYTVEVPGMARREATCSTGWCVGPSSPTPMESCVKT